MKLKEIKCSKCGRNPEWKNVGWNECGIGGLDPYFMCKCGWTSHDEKLISIVEQWLDIKNDHVKLKEFIENVLDEEWIENPEDL